jgi:hypothetical protein
MAAPAGPGLKNTKRAWLGRRESGRSSTVYWTLKVREMGGKNNILSFSHYLVYFS